MPTEKRYEINELTDTESTADAGNMLNGKAVVDEPTVTEFTEIESMDEIIKLFGVFDENLKIIEAETGTNIAADSEKINISGKQSAVDIATDTIDRIHTTATSHSRVFIIEVMGHKVGHVTLHAGIAGGADVILLPEIPYDIDVVTDVIQRRAAADKKFTIIAVAEGAISKEDARLKKKEYKEKLAKRKYPSIAYELAEKIQQKTDKEVRITVPGHTQRGGSPCAYDRVFATRVGAAAAELILNQEYGYMIAMKNQKITKVPLQDVAGKLKMVDPQDGIIKEARTIGISFGDQ